jgi:hypothetical protein
MSNDQDWDDNMDPEIRESVMDATRRAMGLPTRNGGFVVGATDGRKPALYSGISAGGGYSEERRNAKYGTPTKWHDNYEVPTKKRP